MNPHDWGKLVYYFLFFLGVTLFLLWLGMGKVS